MPCFTDQLHRSIEIIALPQRIVSLVPSQTELLHYLGLDEQVSGITKFCVHPKQWHNTKTRVGGTKNINLDGVKALKPQLIIANKEENNQAQIEELEKHFPVWISDINTLDNALEMIIELGKITGRNEAANSLAANIKNGFVDYKMKRNATTLFNNANPKTAYLIWKDPYMTVGGDTFINNMLEWAGFDNIFKNKKRYPVINLTDLKAANCELLLLSSEPYPFKNTHITELQTFLPNTKIILADGEIFSWYGSRLLQAPQYFRQLKEQIAMMT